MTTLLQFVILTICLDFSAAIPLQNKNNLAIVPLIINNSESDSNNYSVDNGVESLSENLINENDKVKGNLVNGNETENNWNTDNVKADDTVAPLIITNMNNNNKNNGAEYKNENNAESRSPNTKDHNLDIDNDITTELLTSESLDELLKQINLLLDIILKRPGENKTVINMPNFIDILHARAKNILINTLHTMSDTLDDKKNIKKRVLSNLLKKQDKIEDLYRNKISIYPEIMFSLNSWLQDIIKNDNVSELPILLEKTGELLTVFN